MAPSVAVLNGARALQGVGAAFQLSAALAILSRSFRGAERAGAFAFGGAIVGGAITVGPVAGGIITQVLGWEWPFYINVAIGVGLILLALHAVTESADPDAGRVDFIGLISFSGGVFALTLALISGDARGWSSTLVILAFGCAAVLFAGFLLAEARQPRPMLDLHLFERPAFVGANIAALAFAMTLLTMLTYLPIFFQSALGFGPRDAGLLMLPLGVPLFIVPRLVAVHIPIGYRGARYSP
jgi:MFS family permease